MQFNNLHVTGRYITKLLDYTASHSRRQESSLSLPWESKT